MKGQSLLETVIAVGIILAGIVPLVALTTMTAKAGRSALETTIASQLAREGIEVVRNKRDSNWKQDLEWDNGLGRGRYVVEFTPESLSWTWREVEVNCDRLLPIHEDFRRLITLLPNDDYLEVRSEVCWGERSYQLVEYLYDWRP